MFELARPPAGVASKDPQTVKHVEQIELIVSRSTAPITPPSGVPTRQRLGGGSGSAFGLTSDPAKADNGVRCDGATDVHDRGFAENVSPSGHPRERDCIAGGNLARSVENDSESPLVVVVEKEDDAAGEVGIVKRRRSDQKGTCKRGIDHSPIMPSPSRSCTTPNALRRNHGHQLTPMPSATMWPHDVARWRWASRDTPNRQ